MLAVVQAVESVAANPLPLFGVGLGWSLSFDTATVELADLTTPTQRVHIPGSTSCSRVCSGRCWPYWGCRSGRGRARGARDGDPDPHRHAGGLDLALYPETPVDDAVQTVTRALKQESVRGRSNVFPLP